MELVESNWNTKIRASNAATRLAAKFKTPRRVLKKWRKSISKINNLILQCNEVLSVLDKLEEIRTLYTQENNFRKILNKHMLHLLQCRKEYLSERYIVRWTKFGIKSTKFLDAAVTERFRHNTITSLEAQDGRIVTEDF